MQHIAPLASLELSHVFFNPTDPASQLLAILTLSPIMVIPAYLVAFVFEREAVVLNMLSGQVSTRDLATLFTYLILYLFLTLCSSSMKPSVGSSSEN